MNQNKVLSQSEIDALLSPAQTEEDVPAEEPKVVPVRLVARENGAVPMAHDSVLESLQSVVAQLAERLNGVDATLGGLATLGKAVDDVNTVIHGMQQSFQAVVQRLETLNSQVESMSHGLRGTLGYDARSTFTCRSCTAEGSVAARIKCTSCGTENWWGWWPGS